MKNLVVGAGFSGSVIANLIATNLNEEVIVIDKKDHIAGNCYDFRDENNVRTDGECYKHPVVVRKVQRTHKLYRATYEGNHEKQRKHENHYFRLVRRVEYEKSED